MAAITPATQSRSPGDIYRGRLFRKYLLLILTLVTGVLLVSGAISVYFSYHEIRSALADLQHEKAIAAASRIEQYIRQIDQQLAYAALPQLDASDVEMRRIEFLKLLRQAPEVTDIAQLDARGREQIAVSRLGMDVPGSGKDRSQEPAFINAKRGKPWFGPVYFRKETEPYLTIAIRSGGDNGPVTIADINLKFIWDVVSRIKIGEEGKAYVVDSNGFLIADPDIGLVLRKTNLSNLTHIKAAIANESSGELATISTDLKGKSVLTSVAPIETLDWKVFVEQPVSEVYAKLYSSALRSVLLLLAGLLVSALGALAMARGMARPIRILDDGARRIGAGELDQKIDIHTGDELEGLANQFNRMTEKLSESYASLERKVEERTHELASALEQQTAISEILRVISASPTDVQPVLRAVAERATHLCRAQFARVLLVDGEMLVPRADYAVSGGETGVRVAPVVLRRTSISGRAALDRTTIHHADVVPLLDSEYPDSKPNAQLAGFRAVLAVPLVREGGAYGAIFLWRREVGLFSPSQVALVETFARQAAIAIDNVRLFNETKEALDKQTATSEILRVISSSPTSTQPVFDAIAERAARLCGANQSFVFTYDGAWINVGSSFGADLQATGVLRENFPKRAGSHTIVGRTVLTGAVVNVPDVLADPDYELVETAKAAHFRGSLGIPMRREGQVVGAITVTHETVGKFTDRQIDLLTTFADQAVIAIENVRLFNETNEALAQQTAISEILRVISGSPTDVRPMLDAIAERALKLCDAAESGILLVEGDRLRFAVGVGTMPIFVEGELLPLSRSLVVGRAIIDRKTIHHADIVPLIDSEYPDAREIQQRFGFRALLTVPLMREDVAIGAIILWRPEVREFTDKQVALVKTFANQAAIAIENVRLFNETKEALAQQTAISEILRVISGSPTDVQPMLDAVAERALKLCDAAESTIVLVQGDALRFAAGIGSTQTLAKGELMPLSRGSVTGRAVIDRTLVHLEDLAAAPVDEFPIGRELQRRFGHRAILSVPLMREDRAIGAIALWRMEARAFTDKQISLVKTFADQAAIAIENVRLFNETKEALEQQTAISEILKVISGSPTDVQPVLDAIAERAAHLCDASAASMYLTDGDVLRHLTSRGPSPDPVSSVDTVPITRASVSGRALLEGRTIQVLDMKAESSEYPLSHRIAIRLDHRTVVVTPLYREGKPFGTILLRRKDVRPFDTQEIGLLRTFGDQAAIALENVRLFREIQDKSQQLETANKHKSEFLANMSHELRTPLNAIIGFSEVLLERLFGEINEKQDDYLKDIHSSGRHLLQLINDILDLSKVEAGRMDLDVAAFDLPSAISNAMTLIRERAQRHGITLGVDADAGLGEIVADERKFKQILLNLLTNAVKFTPDGGRIDVGARREGDSVVVAVHDTGIGIAPEDQEAVFEEFRQVGRDYTNKHEGTGLGLALTRKFVELHGGRIWVESALGKGSTFTFTIPATR